MLTLTQAEATDALELIALAVLGDITMLSPEDLLLNIDDNHRMTDLVIRVMRDFTKDVQLVPDGDWSTTEADIYKELCSTAGIID